MRPPSLRTRVLLAMAAVVTVSTLATALGSGTIVAKFAGRSIEEGLHKARINLRRHLKNRQQLLGRSLQTLSAYPLLRATLQIPGVDPETLAAAATQVRDFTGFDRVVLRVAGQATAAGRAQAEDASGGVLQGETGPLWTQAEQGELSSGILLDTQKRPYLTTVTPVVNRGRLLGTLLLAERIDDELATELSQAAANPVLCGAGGRIQAHSGLLDDPVLSAALAPVAGALPLRPGGRLQLADGREFSVARLDLDPAEIWLLRDAYEFADLQREIWQSIAGFGLLGIVLALLISRWLTTRLARPLNALVKAAGAIADGELDVQVREAGPVETAELGGAFNHMAAQVKTLVEEVQHRASTMETQANELRWANQRKAEFLSSASHELRTPVTNMTASVELLLHHGADADPEARREFLAALESETARLRGLVDKMFELTEVADGVAPGQAVGFDLVELLRQTARDFGAEADTSQRVDCHSELDECELHGDPVQLRQLLLHQLDNARKFSPQDSRIELRLSRDEAQVRLVVADRGGGVPESDRERVFQRFVQGGDLLVDKPSGLGLGLSICREIAQQHGGRIYCRAREGGGSEFVTELPLPVLAESAGSD